MKTSVSRKLVLLGLSIVFCFSMLSAVNAQPGQFVKGVLQPLADGFPKQAINIVVVDDPGTKDDLYAKSLQAALKGVSPVNILVSTEPAAMGGTFYKMQETLKRAGGADGYYPIVISGVGVATDPMIEQGVRDLGGKMEDINMIISTDILPYAMLQRKNAPWGKTFADLVKYGKANPGKLKYISYEIGTGTDITCEYILNISGVKVQKMPQGTRQECASTVGGGMGDFTMLDLPTTITNYEAGVIDVIMVTGDEVPELWRKDPNVVTMKKAGLGTFALGSLMGLAVPKQVPQAHVDWMFKLFKFAANTDLHKKRLQTYSGLSLRALDSAAANAEMKEIAKNMDPILRKIGMHLDSKK